jgi:hypothetical protein
MCFIQQQQLTQIQTVNHFTSSAYTLPVTARSQLAFLATSVKNTKFVSVLMFKI